MDYDYVMDGQKGPNNELFDIFKHKKKHQKTTLCHLVHIQPMSGY